MDSQAPAKPVRAEVLVWAAKVGGRVRWKAYCDASAEQRVQKPARSQANCRSGHSEFLGAFNKSRFFNRSDIALRRTPNRLGEEFDKNRFVNRCDVGRH